MAWIIRIASIATILALLMTAAGFWLGIRSADGSPKGLSQNRLHPCPDSPNCITTEYPEQTAHFEKPMPLDKMDWEALSAVVVKMGGSPVSQKKNYRAFLFSSSFFGFKDDVEFRWDTSTQTLHIRSASRVGHSDLGANRKRVKKIKKQLLSILPSNV